MQNKEIVDVLLECAATCEWCADQCLNEDQLKKLIDCIRTDRDCATICRSSAELLIRDSKYSAQVIDICEQVCRDCAEECEKHEHDHCRACADACRRCEEVCKNYKVSA
jgi:hypothetical protein